MSNKFISWLNRYLNPFSSSKIIGGESLIKPSKLETRATELVKLYDTYDASGEWKRHNVYARLIEEFPLQRKRVISLMIESVIDKGII